MPTDKVPDWMKRWPKGYNLRVAWHTVYVRDNAQWGVHNQKLMDDTEA